PSRYLVTEDDIVVMASEAGVLPVDESKIIMKGRLQPGKMFVADLEKGRIISDEELKQELINEHPFENWVKEGKVFLRDLSGEVKEESFRDQELLRQQLAFGYSREDLKSIIGPMANSGAEPIGSMGADIPLPPLSKQPQHLSSYFKQLFAQVSNPPIDPIREKMVMSLNTNLGSNMNTLSVSPEHCKHIALEQPVLRKEEVARLKAINDADYRSIIIDIYFDKDGDLTLERAIDRITALAVKAVIQGYKILIISDRKVSKDFVSIPSLLALGAIHQTLVNYKLRAVSSLVVEAADVRETHHFATLIGFGANAVCPYLAFDSIRDLYKKKLLKKGLTLKEADSNYINAIGYGLRKIFSKMGISTLQSYQGAQIFEVIGLNSDVVDRCFTKTVTRIQGIGFEGIERECLKCHNLAYPEDGKELDLLKTGGVYEWRKDGESHLFSPEAIYLLQKSTRMDDYAIYKQYTDLINNQSNQAFTLRGLFDFKKRDSVPVDEVEPAENIYKRFATGAMSFGSISYEAHSTLAIAMNRIGGKSNSGEGGEDESRFEKKSNGDWERSAIKQVASGRFGVTSHYLTNADEIQIKMAQGAKPGEGGQLPGHKVDDWIGRVRHSTPGVGLISPPPHHDIYSIEDLAQLIYDLKRANREARINVKLVSEAGVGTIASGVAKAKADVVLISGYDGGTGASPISSIRHTGLPWEIGLAETHQTLIQNKLRNRITVQADGQMKTGRDLAVATLLGAEEWGVATAALVVEGCVMMRKCHLNTCPVGVATQNPDLRKKFTGKPEYVVNYFKFLAEDLREIMAELGFRTVDEMVGQADVLKVQENIREKMDQHLDLSPILFKAAPDKEDGAFKQIDQQHELFLSKDWELLNEVKPSVENGMPITASFDLLNTDRAVGSIISNEISKKYGNKGLPQDTIHLKFKGSAGQSFGAFGAKGITFEMEGEANDYFGKGLSGADLIIYPHKESKYKAESNQIIGNVALYGSTSGTAYINGQAGERFCV
ncbi:MAG: glutamate synthase large subunit, partial [Bacteroidota bacterium]